mmetsp:Transcript_12635/g.25118  ORF Transcript_12635/g.25118 Transcript_12635/m.25118 type:complete len:398 (-) Transcript_12635:723-1916(-)
MYWGEHESENERDSSRCSSKHSSGRGDASNTPRSFGSSPPIRCSYTSRSSARLSRVRASPPSRASATANRRSVANAPAGIRSNSDLGYVTPNACTIASSQRTRAAQVDADGGVASMCLTWAAGRRNSPRRQGKETDSLCTSRLLTTQELVNGSAIASCGMKSTRPCAWPRATAYRKESHHSCGSAVVARPNRKQFTSCCSRWTWVASPTRKTRIAAAMPSTPCRRSMSSRGTTLSARRATKRPWSVSEEESPRQRGTPCSLCIRSFVEPRTGKMRNGEHDTWDEDTPPISALTIIRTSSCPGSPRSMQEASSAERYRQMSRSSSSLMVGPLFVAPVPPFNFCLLSLLLPFFFEPKALSSDMTSSISSSLPPPSCTARPSTTRMQSRTTLTGHTPRQW